MKYVLSKKEWEEIRTLVDRIKTNVDCMYVEAYKQNKSGDIKYDRFVEYIKEITQEAQESLDNLKSLTE